ncbi:MAG: AAA family ATPase [Kiritimatiellae bacterium]|nr:AAA family ATPase [Kiritimatiellia bacterium]
MSEIVNYRIPYGISDFRRIRNEGLYYVDKTEYLAKMEALDSFVFFVRPRRFGKSLFISMMESYYDLNQKKDFQKLFGGLWLGEHPTEYANRYMVLKLDFSKVGGKTNDELEKAFNEHVGKALDEIVARYPEILGKHLPDAFSSQTATAKFADVVSGSRLSGIPLYLIIDEYDNFTNQMIRATGVEDYRNITHGAGFYRNWFKKFKGDFDRIFMTGVSPVTMDDLTSGFNIASNLSQESEFNAMLGFSEAEVAKMFHDYKGVGRFTEGDPDEIVRSIRPWYDGYCFATKKIGKESVFNSDMALYYLKHLVATGEPPGNMVDGNIRTDYDKLKTITDIQRMIRAGSEEDVLDIVETLGGEGEIPFDLVDSFPAEQIVAPKNFKSLFFYYGIVTMSKRREGYSYFKVPNVCVRRQVLDHLRMLNFERGYPDMDEWARAASRMAYRGEWRPFFDLIAANFKKSGAVRDGKNCEARVQGYHQAEFAHLQFYLARPEMELSGGYSDFFLFPKREGDDVPTHSYIVELKYSAADAPDSELAAKREQGIRQLREYAADPAVPTLAKDTTLRLVLLQWKFHDMVNCELVEERKM